MRLRRSARIAAALAVVLTIGAPASITAATADDQTPAPSGGVRVIALNSEASAASRLVDSMTLREKAASVVMGHVPTTDTAVLAEYMARTGIGGFILMGANIPPTEAELQQVTAALTIDDTLPPLIAVDQEGGDVSRLPWDAFPSSLTLKDAAPSATEDAFAGRAALVQRAGIGVNFGIVADVTPDPNMFIYRRALGTTPGASGERVAAAVTGEEPSTMATLKHFPGHGAAPGDSHSSIPSSGLTHDQWAAADGGPFAAGIDAGADMLMFGHLAYTAVDPAPATLSAEWHRIAREELGFTGIAITDDLGMLQASGIAEYADPVANSVAAIAAGNDMVLSVMFSTADSAPQIVDGIVAAVESGTLSTERLDEAATRVTEARLRLAAQGRGLVPCADCVPVD